MLTKKIQETLDRIEAQYDEMQVQLNDPAVSSDFEKFSKLNKKAKSIESTVFMYKEYKGLESTNKELEILSKEDSDMEEIAKAEIKENSERISTLSKDIKLSLIPKDEFDDKNIIMELRGAVGGEEANLFAQDLLEMYKRYFDKRK